MRIARCNLACGKGRSFSQSALVIYYKIVKESMSFRGRGSRPANGIIIYWLAIVRRDLRIFAGEARNVSDQRLNRRVTIMVDRCNCCARRDSKIQRTNDGEKTIMIEIKW